MLQLLSQLYYQKLLVYISCNSSSLQMHQKKTNLKKDDYIMYEKSSTEFLLLLHWNCKGAEAEDKKIHKVFKKLLLKI